MNTNDIAYATDYNTLVQLHQALSLAPTEVDPMDARYEAIPRPFVLPTMPRINFDAATKAETHRTDGPHAVVSRKTGRIVGTTHERDRNFWTNAGYIVG